MEVASHLQHFPLLLNQDGFEAALKDRPVRAVRPIELDGVGHIEPPNRVAQVGPLRAHQQVIMIVHQHESVHLQPGALRQLPHGGQKPPPIRVVQIQRFPAMPPIHHVIPRSRHVQSQCPCHSSRIQPLPAPYCQHFRRDPIALLTCIS